MGKTNLGLFLVCKQRFSSLLFKANNCLFVLKISDPLPYFSVGYK